MCVFYFFGFWAPIILQLRSKSLDLNFHVVLNSLVNNRFDEVEIVHAWTQDPA